MAPGHLYQPELLKEVKPLYLLGSVQYLSSIQGSEVTGVQPSPPSSPPPWLAADPDDHR